MKKIALIMLAIVSMALVSCGGGSVGTMTPQTTKIAGELGDEFEVVDQPVNLQGNVWSIQLKSLTDKHHADVREPFGSFRLTKLYDHVGFGLETYNQDGSLIAKRGATEEPYSKDDIKELMHLREGETGIIRFTRDDSEKGVKGMTFKITSAKVLVN